MALRKFKIVTKDFANYATEAIGVSQDNTIRYAQQDENYGDDIQLWLQAGSPGKHHAILKVVMPRDEDIENFDKLIKVEMVFTVDGVDTAAWIGVFEFEDIWDEGSGTYSTPSTADSNWKDAQTLVPWSRGDGIIKSAWVQDSNPTIDEEDGTLYDVQVALYGGQEISFDLTPALSMGDIKSLIFWVMRTSESTGGTIKFGSRHRANLSERPTLRITYKDFSVEAFTDKENALSIEPSPDNPEFPLLKWGGVSDSDFVDFKLYRSENPITSVTAPSVTLLATITSPENQEYVDKTIATNGTDDGKTFYYLVIAEDANNTGNDATFSTNVSFRKPDVALTAISPSGTSDVGDTIRVTVTSNSDIKRLFVDWKDGAMVWYEFETVALSKFAEHVYSAMVSTTTLGVRVESDTGFWSSLRPTADSIEMLDKDPVATLIARPLAIALGEKVFLNASLSHPIASNERIKQYSFLRTGAGWSSWQAAPTLEWIPSVVGLNEASVQVETFGGKFGTSSSQEIMVEELIATLLNFSKDTKITSRSKAQDTNVSSAIIEGGSGEVDVRIGLRNPRITLNGITSMSGLKMDLAILEDAVQKYTFVAVRAFDELCDKYVYYEGRLIDFNITKSSERVASWTASMRVAARKEYNDPLG